MRLSTPEDTDLALRDMACAMATVARCRQLASVYRQAGFPALAAYHHDNAVGAERWLVKAGRAYPRRCDSAGRPFDTV